MWKSLVPGQTVARSRATPPKASTTLACGRSSPGPVGGHHRIDPNTAAPSTTDLAAVTVIAPSGWEVEAHATAALSRGRVGVGVVGYLEGYGLHGLAVTAEGAALRTAGLAHLDLDIGRDVNIDRDGQRIGAQR